MCRVKAVYFSIACSLMLLPAVVLAGLAAAGAGGGGWGLVGDMRDMESPLLAVLGLRGISGEPRLDIVGSDPSLSDCDNDYKV